MGPGLGRGFRVWSSSFCLMNVARFLRQPLEEELEEAEAKEEGSEE